MSFVLRLLILVTLAGLVLACSDDNAKIAQLAASNNIKGVNGCSDAISVCNGTDYIAKNVREHCCATCGLQGSGDSSLPRPDDNDPVHLFLQAGQSDCVGQANPNLLRTQGKYPDLSGAQTGVWFAGSPKNFFISPMEAGREYATRFGPEISFGKRVQEVTGNRVMVVKYCWGGSSVKKNWNPSTPENSWSEEEDDKTAKWLLDNGVANLNNKDKLFANLIYTSRLTTEALASAGVKAEWKGFTWIQGSADKTDPWETIGVNTARLFDAVRDELGVWDLPIMDTGANAQHGLMTGKVHAAQIVKGCNVATVEYGVGAEDPDSTCQISPSNPCEGSTYMNHGLFDHYGWDTGVPDELKPPGSSNETFYWWKKYPSNLHAAYEGQILTGRMLANAYITQFTTTPLPLEMLRDDPTYLFPFPSCRPIGSKPSSSNICWMDQRGRHADKICVPQSPSPSDSAASAKHLTRWILVMASLAIATTCVLI